MSNVTTEHVGQVRKPIPSSLSKAAVQEFAENAARNLGFKPGDAIEPLIEKLGGRIVFYTPVDELTGIPESISVEPSGKFTIYLTSLTSAKRDRFTIAHELGHYLLHYPLVANRWHGSRMVATRWVDESDDQQRRGEWEANWFAASFLMPAKAFQDAVRIYEGNLSVVALMFGVSEKAAEVRARSLELA
ncbi:ImmA/IrrE family metallo-endopeptidase [Aureimonas ureilytica]|uniref:ImmA/IrrE family metallo-endopeptidase n=1 Tax=Aureimonas ureilytica TaxID=401562 RepID=UPI0009E8F16C|nr:ImmA/IrrE family metallo-endopeptidase [Aureimonas ureilytica]